MCLRKCCPCIGLRSGGYLAAGYTMVLGTIWLTLGGLLLLITRSLNNYDDSINIITIAGWVVVISCSVWIILAILLVIGIHKGRTNLFVPWMIMTGIVTLLGVIGIILGFINLRVTFATAVNAVSFIVQLAIIFLNIYAIVGVASLRKSLDRNPAQGTQEPASGGVTDFSKDENEARGNWSWRPDFLLACLGYVVSFDNIWRFPYLCYAHGGAGFLIPYSISLVFLGMPMLLLEMSVGQYTSSGPLTSWGMAPIFKGLGAGMMMVSAFYGLIWSVVISWSIFYLFASFTADLPWQHCHHSFNTEWCRTQTHTISNGTLVSWDFKVRRPSEEYWINYVLRMSPGLEDLGTLRWELCLCLLLSWIVVCLSLIKGIKSSGKVVYVTVLLPYVVLLILLVRGLTLPGSDEGLKYYLRYTNLRELLSLRVWQSAAMEVVFTLGIGYGGSNTLASYNRFHNDILRDAIIISIGNGLTSIMAGFVIFSSLGFLAHELQRTVPEIITGGSTLLFDVYPAAIARMPGATVWAILFFLMLITLGLSTQFGIIQTMTTCILDQWPQTRRWQWVVVMITCLIFFVLGLPMCTEGGYYLVILVDVYGLVWAPFVIALGECLCISWFYGVLRFKEDIRIMLANNSCGYFLWYVCAPWWIINWAFITPGLLVILLILSWKEYAPLAISGPEHTYLYPKPFQALGWLMFVASLVAMVVTGATVFIRTKGSFTQRVRRVLTPSTLWGPALVKHRQQVKHLKNFVVDPTNEGQPPVSPMGTPGINYELTIVSTQHNDNPAHSSAAQSSSA